MGYTPNEIKVYTNSGMYIEYKTKLDSLVAHKEELTGLCDLFIQGGNPRQDIYLAKKKEISVKLRPQITEAKRLLKNCENRLSYNFARC